MSISATEAVTAASPATGFSAATPSTTTAAEDKQMFMELMVAQLRYQDPLNPTDSGEFLAQSAQFTALEKMQALADGTTKMLTSQMAFGASSLVGRTVSWTDADGTAHSGAVDGVDFGTDGPTLQVGDSSLPLSQVQSIRATTA